MTAEINEDPAELEKEEKSIFESIIEIGKRVADYINPLRCMSKSQTGHGRAVTLITTTGRSPSVSRTVPETEYGRLAILLTKR